MMFIHSRKILLSAIFLQQRLCCVQSLADRPEFQLFVCGVFGYLEWKGV